MIADELIPCCNCKKPMYEKAEECPHCGTHYTYISTSDFERELGTKRTWYVGAPSAELLRELEERENQEWLI